MHIQTVGVIGAGVMGSGLTQNLAQTGHEVILVDISDEALMRVKDNLIDSIRLQMMFSQAPIKDDPHDIFSRIRFTTDLANLKTIDFVIENVTEKVDIKLALFKDLDQICDEKIVFASNTSAIPIAQMAQVTGRADQFIGMHFMNPVPMKPAVELIVSEMTSDETIQISQQLLSQMHKEWVMVKDSPGFVSNRVLMLTINEAIYLVQEAVASPKDVDKVFKSCFSHRMGPLETADLIGLDTILLSLEVLQDHLNSLKFEPCPLLKKMVSEGKLGRKSGIGFFEYPK